jgi:hypothetical protein
LALKESASYKEVKKCGFGHIILLEKPANLRLAPNRLSKNDSSTPPSCMSLGMCHQDTKRRRREMFIAIPPTNQNETPEAWHVHGLKYGKIGSVQIFTKMRVCGMNDDFRLAIYSFRF